MGGTGVEGVRGMCFVWLNTQELLEVWFVLGYVM
jgi:hypothetical protein